MVNFKLPLGLTVKRSRSSQDKNEEESRNPKRVKIQNDGQELVVNCDIGRPRCLLCRLSFHQNLFQISCFEKNFSQDFLFRLNMSSPDALRYHNLMRHPDLAPIHTLVSPSKATASAPTSPIKKIAAISPIQHKRLSLPNNIEEVRMPLKRVRVKVMREVEMLKDVGRAALEERLAESPKKVPHPEKTSLEETKEIG